MPDSELKASLPTDWGSFEVRAHRPTAGGPEHLSLTLGQVLGHDNVHLRLHSECLTGDIFGSLRCDCGPQLWESLETISSYGRGAVVYLRQEGRGIGLLNKIAAYSLQEQGRDTVQANEELGFAPDERDYAEAIKIVESLGIRSVILMTNNPEKVQAFENSSVRISSVLPTKTRVTAYNQKYLQVKRDVMHHQLTVTEPASYANRGYTRAGGLMADANSYDLRHTDGTPHGVAMSTPIGKQLAAGLTPQGQDFRIFKNSHIDWVMTLNGYLQNCSLDTIFYHEIFAHVPGHLHGRPRRALIVGGASGALAAEFLKYDQLEIEVIEIDPDVPELCRRGLPELARVFEAPRVTRTIADARQAFSSHPGSYDLIMLDIPGLDHPGPTGILSTEEVLDGGVQALRDEGLLVCETEVPFHGNEVVLKNFAQSARRRGLSMGVFGTLSPLYPGGFQTFAWVSKSPKYGDMPYGQIIDRVTQLGIKTEFYDAGVHIGSVAMGRRILEMLSAGSLNAGGS